MEDSKAFKLNGGDFKRLGFNGFLVGLAAALTYIGSNLGELDLGTMGLVAVPIVTILLDAAVKWATNNHQVKPDPTLPAE